MKILQINTVCGSGSIGRIAVDLYKEMENKGHECYIAYGRGNAPRDIRAIRIGKKRDIYFHAIMTRFTDRHGFYSKKATKEFIRWIRDSSFDVIHLHNLHGYYINIKLLFDFLKEFGRPIIWTLHDCWAFTGHSGYCDAIQCARWKTGCYRCPQKQTYPKAYIDLSRKNWEQKREIFNGVGNLTIVTPSQWLASMVENSFLATYPIQVINNGIDTAIFKPASQNLRRYYGVDNKIIIMGVASKWEERKGLDDFIVLSERLDNRYKIILVGLSDKQIKKLPDGILGLKRTNSPKELAGIYSMADVFFCPTYEDNFPTVNLEAQSCGVPVITYRTGGSPETVVTSLSKVVKPGDLESVVEYISNGEWRDKNQYIEELEDQLSYKSMAKAYYRIICEGSIESNTLCPLK